MKGRRPTHHENEATIASLIERVGRLERTIEERDRTIEDMRKRLRHCENENSPPSSGSLEMGRQKAQRRRERREADGAQERGRRAPGGRRGHRGVSRIHRPGATEEHGFPGGRAPACARCGGATEIAGPVVRDIVDIRITAAETRHRIQAAVCPGCGERHLAPPGLPARGSYGRTPVGFMAVLRSQGLPYRKISRVLSETARLGVAKSTVINASGRCCDAMEGPASQMEEEARDAGSVCTGETGVSLAGVRGWAWILMSAGAAAVICSRSRGALVMDRHMDGYKGVVTSDGYSVYKRFDPGGRHQLCWAHGPRRLRYAAESDGAPLFAGVLHRQVLGLYCSAPDCAAGGRRRARLRRRFESRLRRILSGYRDAGGVPGSLVGRLHRALPCLFAFLEHGGVEPTSNAAERGLRSVVLHRKISGRIKGGQAWRDRWSWFMTCILTWGLRGGSVMDEVSRIV